MKTKILALVMSLASLPAFGQWIDIDVNGGGGYGGGHGGGLGGGRNNFEAIQAVRRVNQATENLAQQASYRLGYNVQLTQSSYDYVNATQELQQALRMGNERQIDRQTMVTQQSFNFLRRAYVTDIRARQDRVVSAMFERVSSLTRDMQQALRNRDNYPGPGPVPGQWMCTAVDRGHEEHRAGHPGVGPTQWQAERAALAQCQRFHNQCQVSRGSCRPLR